MLSYPKAINSISIHRKSISLRGLSNLLLPFTHIQMNSGHKHPQGDSAPAAAGVEDQSEHHLMKPESGACSDSDGSARRHAGLSQGRSPFTQVWNPQCQQTGECTSVNVEPFLRVHLQSRTQTVFRSTGHHWLHTGMQTRSNRWATSLKGGCAFRSAVLWIQAGIYFTCFPPENNRSDLSALRFSLTSETLPSARAPDRLPSLGPVICGQHAENHDGDGQLREGGSLMMIYHRPAMRKSNTLQRGREKSWGARACSLPNSC